MANQLLYHVENFSEGLVVTARWLTTKQAAAQLRVPLPTVYRWADEGRIPSTVSTSGHRMFPAALLTPVAHQRDLPAADGRWLTLAQVLARTDLTAEQVLAWAAQERVASMTRPTGTVCFARRDLIDAARVQFWPSRVIRCLSDVALPDGTALTEAGWWAAHAAQDGLCAACGMPLAAVERLLECDLSADGELLRLVCVQCPGVFDGTEAPLPLPRRPGRTLPARRAASYPDSDI